MVQQCNGACSQSVLFVCGWLSALVCRMWQQNKANTENAGPWLAQQQWPLLQLCFHQFTLHCTVAQTDQWRTEQQWRQLIGCHLPNFFRSVSGQWKGKREKRISRFFNCAIEIVELACQQWKFSPPFPLLLRFLIWVVLAEFTFFASNLTFLLLLLPDTDQWLSCCCCCCCYCPWLGKAFLKSNKVLKEEGENQRAN